MKSIKRPLATFGGAALLAVSLTACGGAPTNASVEDFCGLGDEMDGIFDDIADDDYEGFVEAAGEAADRMEEIGTPEDISDDARAGFEAMVDAFGGLDADEVEEAATAMEESDDFDEDAVYTELFGIDEDAIDDVESFTEYSQETCDDSGDSAE